MNRELLEVLVRLRDEFSPVAQRIQGQLNRINRSIEEAAAFSRRMGLAFQAAAGIIVTKSVMAAARLEQLRMGFKTLLGSAGAAEKMLRDLYDFAARTPFEVEGLMQQTRLLLALGFNAREVIPTLRAVGDAVAALGGSNELLRRVVLALGQMRAKGKVSAEEMRQLAEAGIPAWEILAEKIGVSIPEAMKLVEQRAVSAATGIQAIIEGMNQRFAGMMEEQSKTIIGIWSNIKDTTYIILTRIGERIVEVFRVKEGMKAFLEWLQKVRALLEDGVIEERLRGIAEATKITGIAMGGAFTPLIITQVRALGRALLTGVRVLGPWAAGAVLIYKALDILGVKLEDVIPWVARFASGLAGLAKIGTAAAGILFNVLGAALAFVIRTLEESYRAVGDRVRAITVLLDFSRPWRERWAESQRLIRESAVNFAEIWGDTFLKVKDDIDAYGRGVEEGVQLLVDAVTGQENQVTRKVEDIAQRFLESAQKMAEGLGKTLDPALGKNADATEDWASKTSDGVEKVVSWYEVFNDELDRVLANLQRWDEYTGRLGAAEQNVPPPPTPRARFPLVAQPGGTPPTAGGAPLQSLYWTPEQRQAVQQLLAAQRSMQQAGVRTLAITRDQIAAWEEWKATLADLAQYVAGYAAELDEAGYTEGATRRRVEELAEQYKSLRLTMQAVGRTTLYITQNEYQQHQQALADLAYWAAGYAAELDETTYKLAEERQAQEEAAKAAELHAQRIKRLNAALEDLRYSIPARIAEAVSAVVESGDWQALAKQLQDVVLDGIGSVVDAIVPGLGRVITAIGRLFINLARRIGEWLDSWTAAGQERLRQAALKQQAQLAEGFKFVSAEAFSTIQEQTYRFLLWTRKTYKVVVDENARAIAETLDQAVAGAMSRGIRAFLTGAKDWRQQLARAIKEAILEGVVQAIVQKAVLEGLLGPWLDQLTKDLTAGNMEAAQRDMDEIMRRAGEAADWLEQNFARFRDYFKDLGEEQAALGPGGAPPAQYAGAATPTIGLSVPVAALPGFSLQQLVPAFNRLSGAIDRLVDEGVRANVQVTLQVKGDLFGRTLVTAG